MNSSTPARTLTPGLEIRAEFPIFKKYGADNLHFLDSAASAQKPRAVINRLNEYLSNEHANIHRGAYSLSANATDNYELARAKLAAFIGAKDPRTVIFTRGATEGVNLVAYSYGDQLKEGETVLVTLLEHHSNFVPWQMLAKRRKLNIEYVNITDHAEIDLQDLKAKLKTHKPRLLAVTQVANSFGTVTPLAEIIAEARAAGTKVLVDAAQSVQHAALNVGEMNPDFLVFSGHKLYGPTGVGALYVSPDIIGSLQPFQGGGDMISYVSVEGSEWADYPQRFEAGTPAIAEAIAFGEAVAFVQAVGIDKIAKFEKELFLKGWEILSAVPGITLYGPAAKHGPESEKQSAIIPFNIEGIHPHDMATVADSLNVQIRAGHHCAMPALKRLNIDSSARASIGIYSDVSDFHALVEGIEKARRIFAR